MAEYQASSTDTYRLKKLHGCWFLENSYTRKTKRLPFLSSKVNITLEDNFIFADDNVYEIKETDSGVSSIEKVGDLIYTSEQQADGGVSTAKQGRGNGSTGKMINSPELGVHDKSTVQTDTGIKSANDLYYTLQEVDGVTRSVRDINIRSYECDSAEYVEGSKIDGPKLQTKNHQEHHTTQQRAEVTRQVLIEDTKLSKLCGLSGMMELRVNASGFSFYDTNSNSATYTFDNRWVRKYGCSGDMFTFVVGRMCTNGEGEIKVITDETRKLNRNIFHIWHSQSKQ